LPLLQNKINQNGKGGGYDGLPFRIRILPPASFESTSNSRGNKRSNNSLKG